MTAGLTLAGTGVFPDVAVGRTILLNNRTHDIVPLYCVLDHEVRHEQDRFLKAVEATREQIRGLKASMADRLSDTHLAIFDAHLLLLEDSMLIQRTTEEIAERKHNAESVFQGITKQLIAQFNELEDSYLREKRDDLQDISNRVIHNLMHHEDELKDREKVLLKEPSVVVAHIIHPSDVKMLTDNHIVGMATDVGGRTTHTAIIAKALELPAVVGLHDVTSHATDGGTIIVDGIEGKVILQPEKDEIDRYRRKHERKKAKQQALEATGLDAVTTLDGIAIDICANIELEPEIERARRFLADGVGLYRSEFIFLSVAPMLPTEDQHYAFYRKLAENARGDITIRTLDLGGEKFFHEVLEAGSEQNPVLGLRAVRFCMKRKDIFRTQLRAILRASAISDRIRVMFPLISGLDELLKVLAFLEEVKTELRAEGVAFNENMKVGIMVEVPSAAVISDLLVEHVDFFSIGTNDLIQYFLAIDRNNDEVNYLYQPLHPGLLRVLSQVIANGAANGVEVSLCGEMAGNPEYTAMLIGLGLRNFSMTPSSIPFIKEIVSKLSFSACQELAQQALTCGTASQVRDLVSAGNLRMFPAYRTMLEADD